VLQRQQTSTQELQSQAYLAQPAIDDIYFLDFRKLTHKLRPTEKYRLAKVVDITGDIITLQYGNWYFAWQKSAIESIKFGQLRYDDYFESKRHNFSLAELASMHSTSAIYLVKRPMHGKLYGNQISPASRATDSVELLGSKENRDGESYLKITYSETNLASAFALFQRSAALGNPEGQVNLAQMYLNGQHVASDLTMALSWLKQASLQSHKPAILKYAIVCQQVAQCNIVDFYQELTDAGVNIKVRNLDAKITLN
jgi:hypothetical protein